MRWKEGDWCFCEFKLNLIKDVKNSQVREVSDGVICQSSNSLNDRCFALDLGIKNIADTVKWYSDKLHAFKNVKLNYPDIHRYLVSQWVKACLNKDDNVAVENIYQELNDFWREIEDRGLNVKATTVQGISVFGRG